MWDPYLCLVIIIHLSHSEHALKKYHFPFGYFRYYISWLVLFSRPLVYVTLMYDPAVFDA